MPPRPDRARRQREPEDDTPTLSPLPRFTSRQPQIGSLVWIVSRRKERASLCEITGISSGLAQVLMGKETRQPYMIAVPVNRCRQVGEYLWRVEVD